MPSTLDLCEKYYETRDVYKLLGIEKTALEKDSMFFFRLQTKTNFLFIIIFVVKKAYYKMSLLVHPDRVPEGEKELATEKFKVLSKLNSVLTDKDKKSQYDETGVIDDDDEDESSMSKWMEMWKAFFKPITTQDIDNYQKEYVGKF